MFQEIISSFPMCRVAQVKGKSDDSAIWNKSDKSYKYRVSLVQEIKKKNP